MYACKYIHSFVSHSYTLPFAVSLPKGVSAFFLILRDSSLSKCHSTCSHLDFSKAAIYSKPRENTVLENVCKSFLTPIVSQMSDMFTVLKAFYKSHTSCRAFSYFSCNSLFWDKESDFFATCKAIPSHNDYSPLLGFRVSKYGKNVYYEWCRDAVIRFIRKLPLRTRCS